MSHVNMEILKLTKDLMAEIYTITLQLSKLQVFDDVRPITKSICSVTSSLPEAHKIKRYSYEFIKYLVATHASSHGYHHLETLLEKGALTNENLCAALKIRLEALGSVLKGFKQTTEVPTVEPE